MVMENARANTNHNEEGHFSGDFNSNIVVVVAVAATPVEAIVMSVSLTHRKPKQCQATWQ